MHGGKGSTCRVNDIVIATHEVCWRNLQMCCEGHYGNHMMHAQ